MNRGYLNAALDHLHAEHNFDLLIEGGAEGADKLAGRWAMERGIDHVTVWANWEGRGRQAGIYRNGLMLKLFPVELVVAFPGGTGTRNMVNQARAAGVQVIEIGGEPIRSGEAKD